MAVRNLNVRLLVVNWNNVDLRSNQLRVYDENRDVVISVNFTAGADVTTHQKNFADALNNSSIGSFPGVYGVRASIVGTNTYIVWNQEVGRAFSERLDYNNYPVAPGMQQNGPGIPGDSHQVPIVTTNPIQASASSTFAVPPSIDDVITISTKIAQATKAMTTKP